MSAEDWEALIEWLETVEDLALVREAYAELAAAGGDRERAGWQRWEEFAPEPVLESSNAVAG